MHFNFIDVHLLCNGHQHILDAHVAVFGVICLTQD